jgi:probable rRNA maturation factor
MQDESPVDIAVENGGWSESDGAVAERAATAALADHAKVRVSILLSDDAAIRALNRQFRGTDKATNVLSFPAAEMPGNEDFLGDIIVARETTAAEASAEGKSFADHLSHLVIHGVLHLLGEDHETVAEAEQMEAAERAILSRLGIDDPYRDTIPDSV